MLRRRLPMVTPALLTLAATSLLACNSTSLEPVDTATETAVLRSAQAQVVVEGCTALEVELSGRDRIQVTEAGSCATGLRLAVEGTPTFDRRADGRVELPLQVVNASDTDVAPPVRVILAPDSIEVLHPRGFGQNGLEGVTAQNPDSILGADAEFAGGALWRVGGGAPLLPAGEASEVRPFRFAAHDGVRRFRLGFVLEGEVADTSRPEIPEEEFAFPDDTLAFPLTPPDSIGRYYRNLAGVRMTSEATGPEVRAFLTQFSAEIVGGLPNSGMYILRIDDPGPAKQDLLRRLQQINSDPRVELAIPIAASTNVTLDTRYPGDGAGVQRHDWFTSVRSTWALRAIRAPLAWGCVTGQYTDSPLGVAVMDLLFDADHPDLVTSNPTVVSPPPTSLLPDTQLNRPQRFSHGTTVTGILTAEGNNGTGIAGMLWHSQPTLYAFAEGQRSVRSFVIHFRERVVPHLVEHGVKVVVSGMNLPFSTQQEVEYFREGLEQFAESGGLYVRAAGNASVETTIAEFLDSPPQVGDRLPTAQLLQGPLAGHFLIVGGAEGRETAVTRWEPEEGGGSNYIAGAMEIAAPADDILVLRQSGITSAGVLDDGTSIAAPMVAGVAAQLLTMDPTLTAPEVKDYIVRGARSERYNPATGQIEVPGEVPGMPGVYLLDAYGSLKLLSHERPDVPICGVPVRTSGETVILERDSVPGGQTFTLSGTDLESPSVAQGGRRMALTDEIGMGVIVLDHTGKRLQTLSDIQIRHYLETDTADIRWVGDPDLNPADDTRLRITGADGTVGPFRDVVRQAGPPGADRVQAGKIAVSKDGRWAAVSGEYTFDRGADVPPLHVLGAFLLNLRSGDVRLVDEVQCEACFAALPADVAWSHDSRRAFFSFADFREDGLGVDTRLKVGTVAGATQTIRIPLRLIDRLALTADDLLVHATEIDFGNFGCVRTLRATASPTALLSDERTPCPTDDLGIGNLRTTAAGSVMERRRLYDGGGK